MTSANHNYRKVTVTIKAVGAGGKVRRVRSHFGAAYLAVLVAVACCNAVFDGAAVGFSAAAAFAFISCHP
jgi:hypothetical protein